MSAALGEVCPILAISSFVLAPVAAAVTGGLLLVLDQGWAAVVSFLAAATYLLGAFAPTAVVNVPLNNELDRATVPVEPGEAARRWAAYSGPWTRWNHLRTLFSMLSLLLVGLAIFVWGRQW